VARCFRSFISAWSAVMRTARLRICFPLGIRPGSGRNLLHYLPAWNEHTIGRFAQDADISLLANSPQPRKLSECSFQHMVKREQ